MDKTRERNAVLIYVAPRARNSPLLATKKFIADVARNFGNT